jgi:hypothetical protein
MVDPLDGSNPAGADTFSVEPSAAAVVPVDVEGAVGVDVDVLVQAVTPATSNATALIFPNGAVIPRIGLRKLMNKLSGA